MNAYLPQTTKERELTEKQQKFLDCLIQTGGDPKYAAELAGYAEGSYSQVVKSLKNEIIELASHILAQSAPKAAMKLVQVLDSDDPDRKSTRLNSSHGYISYAVFCLKKKTELQSRLHLVCRLLLEKKKYINIKRKRNC